MENKELYYTPEIEDIRVGYKCESTNNGKDWYNWVFQEHNFGALELELMNTMYRTPYLTKEQVESKGWVFKNSKFYYSTSCDSYSLELLPFNIVLIMLIGINEHVPFTPRNLFEGEGKSINEFNYICKLLEID